ncbi:cytoskeleton-associated protein 2-like [Mantella aurantiaca]
MEAPRIVTAEEERRRKLQEYLAAKGRLKPQNHQKVYLKDSTNLQQKGRPQSKQVTEKKDVPLKGTKLGLEANKNRTSNTGLLQSRPATGKIATQQNVLPKKVDHKSVSGKPASSKDNLQWKRPGQAVQSKNISLRDKLLGRKSSFTAPQRAGTEPEVGVTVVLTKSQPGAKARVSDVHLVDKTFESKSQSESEDIRTTQKKDLEPQTLHQPSIKKSQSLDSKPKPVCQKTNSRQPTGEAVPPTSTGHIRIVSRLSQPMSNTGTPTERSFLIKSSRSANLQPQRVTTGRMEQLKSAAHKPSCATKPNTAAKSTSSSATTQKKFCPHPISTTKTMQCGSAHTANKALPTQSRRSISKPAVWQTNTKLTACNRTAARPQTGTTNCTKGTGSKPAVINRTNPIASSSSQPCAIASDTVSKPHTPKMTVEDRRKKLQEWLSSKGKTYKRPPMPLPPKRPPTAKKKQNLNLSVWEGIEAEEELLLLSKKISQTLGECLELIDKGVSSEDIHAALDNIPEGKKFAKYWVCKAKLLEREGVTDVVELYKQGVQSGAAPIDELREVVFDIMKNTSKKSKVVTFGPLPNEDREQHEEKDIHCHATPVIKPVDDMEASCFDIDMCDHGSAVKFQVAFLSSKKKKDGSSQEWKCLTPVRRSLRIHQSVCQYPEVVQEHDTVVGSLDELLDMADTETYLYVRNDALPEEADHTILSMVKHDSSEGQSEKPV